MRPLTHALFSLVAAALLANPGLAQTAAAPSPSDASTSALTQEGSPANTTPAAQSRPTSPGTAARIAEKLPKFTPPKPTDPAPVSTSPVIAEQKFSAATTAAVEQPDLRELDRPRNTIFRLPNYVVQEEKPQRFKERELLTPYGHLQAALKRYPGVRFGSLPFFSNEGWALYFYEADLRKERQAEMNDLVSLVSDPADRAKARAAIYDTFLTPR